MRRARRGRCTVRHSKLWTRHGRAAQGNQQTLSYSKKEELLEDTVKQRTALPGLCQGSVWVPVHSAGGETLRLPVDCRFDLPTKPQSSHCLYHVTHMGSAGPRPGLCHLRPGRPTQLRPWGPFAGTGACAHCSGFWGPACPFRAFAFPWKQFRRQHGHGLSYRGKDTK